MDMKRFYCDYKCLLGVFAVLSVNVSGCCFSGWDFLTEELLPAICPILSSTKIAKDILKSHVIGKVYHLTLNFKGKCGALVTYHLHNSFSNRYGIVSSNATHT